MIWPDRAREKLFSVGASIFIGTTDIAPIVLVIPSDFPLATYSVDSYLHMRSPTF